MELHFTRTNGPVDDAIDELLRLCGDVQHAEIVREMILAAVKAGQEADNRADLKMMNATLKEMRFTSKIFAPYREIRKVAVFGSARTEPDHPRYRMAREFGQRLAQAGYMVVTGAGPGIMQAINEGAGSEHSFGVNIRLPFEQAPNPVLKGNPRLITYKYFFNRKVAFVREAHAIALFPGGFGTLDEAMETLTLIQTGKGAPVPMILMDLPGGTYWKHLLEFFRNELLPPHLISPSDQSLFECVTSVDEGVERIKRFYSRYHSLRYVNGKLVLRMQSPVPAEGLDKLGADFQDLMTDGGGISALDDPLPEEADEPELAHLFRLIIDFNKQDFGRLRQFIDAVNAPGGPGL